MVEYRKEVDDLLTAYAEYKELLRVEAELSMQRARQKIAGVVDTELTNNYETAKKDLQNLSDSMTFSNPFVWIMYKFEAYKNEAQPIRTMRDFRIHCSKEGYICTKRFTFINEQLALRGRQSLEKTAYYQDDMLLDKLLEEKSLQELTNDASFIKLWQEYEYNTSGAKVAKWENYQP